MSNVSNLGARRMERSRDCRDWSCADALREALQLIESGQVKPEMIYIAMSVPTHDGRRDFTRICAGGDKLGMVGLLARHLHLVNDGGV